ncbi:MAG: hypothetical protein IPF53_13980 [Blastocatellia bacterium]|nr:hypothetical protein [Blastocatellia bacterium]
MRILLLLLIAIVAGSAAGSMYSWFLVSEPLPLATATSNANDSTASSAASPTTVPAGSGVRSVASEMPVETDSRQGAAGQQGVLGQQAQKSDALRAEAEKAQPVTADAPPAAPAAAPQPPVNRSAVAAPPPAAPAKEGTNYALPIGIGLITAILAYIVANRIVSNDI